MRTMVAILLVKRHVFAGSHRARRYVAVEGSADGGIGHALLGLRQLRFDAFERCLRSGNGLGTLPRGVGRGFVLLLRRIGLRFGGFLLRVRLFEGASRYVAGRHQIGVALRIRRRKLRLRLRRLIIRQRGGHFRNPGRDRTRRSTHPMRDCACRTPAVASCSCARACCSFSSRVAVVQFADDLALRTCAPTSTGVEMHAARHRRRDVGAFIRDKGAGLLEIRRHLTRYRGSGRHRDGLRALPAMSACLLV